MKNDHLKILKALHINRSGNAMGVRILHLMNLIFPDSYSLENCLLNQTGWGALYFMLEAVLHIPSNKRVRLCLQTASWAYGTC